MSDMSGPTPSEDERTVRDAVAAADVAAPPAVHAAVARMVSAARAAPASAERRRPRWLAPGVAGALATAAAVALLVPGTGGGRVDVAAAARLSLLPALAPAPRETGDRLAVRTAGITFPYWGGLVGWTAAGTRADTLGGRRVVTVFYRAHGAPGAGGAPAAARIGYSIVDGPALAVPAGARVTRAGNRFVVVSGRGLGFVTWRRAGHTCVIAGRGVPATVLLRLAALEA